MQLFAPVAQSTTHHIFKSNAWDYYIKAYVTEKWCVMRSHQNTPQVSWWAKMQSIPVYLAAQSKTKPGLFWALMSPPLKCWKISTEGQPVPRFQGPLESPWLCPWLLTLARSSAPWRGPPQHQIRSRHPVTAVTMTRPDPSFPSLLPSSLFFSSNIFVKLGYGEQVQNFNQEH